jgi:hypothetical protein
MVGKKRTKHGIRFVLLEWNNGSQYSISIESSEAQSKETCRLYAPLEEFADPVSGECCPPKIRYETTVFCDRIGGRYVVELLVTLANTPTARMVLNQAANDACHALLRERS